MLVKLLSALKKCDQAKAGLEQAKGEAAAAEAELDAVFAQVRRAAWGCVMGGPNGHNTTPSACTAAWAYMCPSHTHAARVHSLTLSSHACVNPPPHTTSGHGRHGGGGARGVTAACHTRTGHHTRTSSDPRSDQHRRGCGANAWHRWRRWWHRHRRKWWCGRGCAPRAPGGGSARKPGATALGGGIRECCRSEKCREGPEWGGGEGAWGGETRAVAHSVQGGHGLRGGVMQCSL